MNSLGTLKKSSAMIDGIISSNFDLNNIYCYFPLSESPVTCLKYNNKQRTLTSEDTCKTFNNQISLILHSGMNIKIFNTGAFSVSGAGNVENALDNARESIIKVLECLKKVRFTKEITPLLVNNFYTFHDTAIVTVTDKKDLYECKHFIKGTNIIIEGEKCEKFNLLDNLYIDIKHKNKIKKLYNNLAQEVGHVEYIMKRKTKSLCIKNCTYVKKEDQTYDILNKYNTSIGILKIVIDSSIEKKILPPKIDISIKICSERAELQSIKFSNCNYNFKVSLDKQCFIDRDKICMFLESHKVAYTYDPCSYPGVKFLLNNTKVTIFRTGSILFSSKEDIYESAYPFVVKIFENDMICNPIVDTRDETEEEISIWDL